MLAKFEFVPDGHYGNYGAQHRQMESKEPKAAVVERKITRLSPKAFGRPPGILELALNKLKTRHFTKKAQVTDCERMQLLFRGLALRHRPAAPMYISGAVFRIYYFVRGTKEPAFYMWKPHVYVSVPTNNGRLFFLVIAL